MCSTARILSGATFSSSFMCCTCSTIQTLSGANILSGTTWGTLSGLHNNGLHINGLHISISTVCISTVCISAYQQSAYQRSTGVLSAVCISTVTTASADETQYLTDPHPASSRRGHTEGGTGRQRCENAACPHGLQMEHAPGLLPGSRSKILLVRNVVSFLH